MEKTHTTYSIVSDEEDCRLLMLHQLKNGAKYSAIVKIPAEQWSTLGMEWTGGKYNSAERMALEVVAEACELENVIDADASAGLRRIAEFTGTPYKKLLLFYTEKYIFGREALNNGSYVDYKTLLKWKQQQDSKH